MQVFLHTARVKHRLKTNNRNSNILIVAMTVLRFGKGLESYEIFLVVCNCRIDFVCLM